MSKAIYKVVEYTEQNGFQNGGFICERTFNSYADAHEFFDHIDVQRDYENEYEQKCFRGMSEVMREKKYAFVKEIWRAEIDDDGYELNGETMEYGNYSWVDFEIDEAIREEENELFNARWA